jgi:nucleotide-binding universal stress UspA family protein
VRDVIVLMHSFELPLIGFPDGAMIATAELTSRIVEGAQQALDKEVAARKDAGVTIRPLLRQGDAWQMVLATAEETGANLIIMGTHGRKGLPRALIGSVAEKIVRTALVPVLIVHAHDVEPAR